MRSIIGKVKWLSAALLFSCVFFSGMLVEGMFSGNRRDISFPGTAMAQSQETGGSLPDVVEKVVPAVVYIQSKAIIKQREQADSPMLRDPRFRRFFEDFFKHYNMPREREQKYLGSGVIVGEDGYILTNNHLVQNTEEIEVILPDKRQFDATVVGTDPRSDIAVLKIDSEGLPVVSLGSSEDLRLGQTVLAIGYPYAVGQTVTRGIVSALGRSLNLVDYEDFIQTDAAINPGNSGGALINTRGELVGINTAIYSRSGGNQGIGFAIPIELARQIMESIIEHGRVIRGYVGVVPQDVNPDMKDFFGLEDANGVLLSHVAEDSPADKAGLKRGDVVIRFNGRKIRTSDEFRRYAAEAGPGVKVKVEIIRNGKNKEIEIRMGEHPADEPAADEKDIEERNPVFLGVGLETLADDHRQALNIPSRVKGVIITQVDRSTSAEKAGLNRGDVLVEVNRKRITDISDFRDVLDSTRRDKVLLLVYRSGNYFYVAISE
ncbi:MAG: Do family serine endopeptidase [Bacteroidales bacterium]|nr:Do family serine endopeptidase [Candidatus Latescibacterota bacterium]